MEIQQFIRLLSYACSPETKISSMIYLSVNICGIVLKMLSVIAEINLQSVESRKAALVTVPVQFS